MLTGDYESAPIRYTNEDFDNVHLMYGVAERYAVTVQFCCE